MDINLQELKVINPKDQCLVFGYVRNAEKELIQTNKSSKFAFYQSIPAIVSYVCLSYYYLRDYFAKCGDSMMIEGKDKDTVKMKKNVGYTFQTAYFANWITPGTAIKYVFQIKKYVNGIVIGIIDEDGQFENFQYEQTKTTYSYRSNKEKVVLGKIVENVGPGYDTGDEVTMIVDLKQFKLTYVVNGTGDSIVFDGIKPIKYKVAVALICDEASVSIASVESVN